MILAERIVHQIVSDDLPAGSKLAPEREMLADFGVGRGTLREALRFLELQGVITLRPGPRGGPVVAVPSERQLASTLALLLEMDRTTYREILSARITMEPVLAAQAAERITAKHLEQLKDENDLMRDSINQPEVFSEQHHRFHRLIVDAAGNHVLLLIMSSLHWITEGSIPWAAFPERERNKIVQRHDLIIEALEAHDPAATAAAILEEDKGYERFVLKAHSEAMRRTVRWASRLA